MAYEQNHINKYNKEDKKKTVTFTAETFEVEEDVDENEVADELQKVIDEYNKIAQEKKDWQILLEASQIEVDLLTEELKDVKMQLNSVRKSSSHCSVRSNRSILNRRRSPNQSSNISNRSILNSHSPDNSEQSKKTYRKGMWVLDSGCSRYMCGKKENFKTIKKIDGGCVRFGDNAKGELQVILGYGIENLDTRLGKQTRSSLKDIVSTSKPLQLLYMDLFGPTRTASIGGKRYAFVIVDDFTWNNLGKFDPRSNEGIFLGYAPISKAFRVFNKRTLNVKESVHVVFDDTNPRVQESKVGDDEVIDIQQTEDISQVSSVQSTEDIAKATLEPNTDKSATTEMESTTPVDKANIAREWRHNANYLENYILGKPNDKMQTRSSLREQASVALISQNGTKTNK
ncbi:uncharacterized protein LOC125829593 [Solanum verrucosum]|uniref:uncharacterized protein LOC125829593 n=1 Tax=Solanum verrucosum TaxID=315347 RepID=UPI0020D1E0F8|nr:uncharacterized protein LOC125829593 [Solanum verrucosum]